MKSALAFFVTQTLLPTHQRDQRPARGTSGDAIRRSPTEWCTGGQAPRCSNALQRGLLVSNATQAKTRHIKVIHIFLEVLKKHAQVFFYKIKKMKIRKAAQSTSLFTKISNLLTCDRIINYFHKNPSKIVLFFQLH